jgi:hypothetical protein
MFGWFLAVETATVAGMYIRSRFRAVSDRAVFFGRKGEKSLPMEQVLTRKMARPAPSEDWLIKVADKFVDLIRQVVQYQAFRTFIEDQVLRTYRKGGFNGQRHNHKAIRSRGC